VSTSRQLDCAPWLGQGRGAAETYRHFEFGIGPDDGARGPSGMEAAIGVRPRDAVERMAWDHAVERPSVARGRALEREPLGIDL